MILPVSSPAADRRDAVVETSITVGLLAAATLVTVARNGVLNLVPFFAERTALSDVLSLAVTLLIDVCFVIVVYVRAITETRKPAALVAGLIATALDIGTYAMFVYVPLTDVATTALSWVTNSTSFLFVVAWGLSRRRHVLWVVGLVPAAVVSILLVWAYELGTFWDNFGEVGMVLVSGAAWYAAIGLGCLACWGFDVAGRTLAPRPSTSNSR